MILIDGSLNEEKPPVKIRGGIYWEQFTEIQWDRATYFSKCIAHVHFISVNQMK